jgi:hypothetical protein
MEYEANKVIQKYSNAMALAIGKAIGVAVDIIEIQEYSGDDLEVVQRKQAFWHSEPLFNDLAQPTREYFHRLNLWMKTRMYLLNNQLKIVTTHAPPVIPTPLEDYYGRN